MSRRTKMATLATRYIKPSDQKETIEFTSGGLDDIIKVILKADRESAQWTKDFAPLLRKGDDYSTLRNIWDFVRRNIRYVADRTGYEKIKSPGATWASRYADCKGMSVFVGSILRNLGYDYYYKVVFYDKNRPEQGHIYPVVLLGDQEIIIDAVHYRFDEEVPYWKGYAYSGTTGEKVAISGSPVISWYLQMGLLALSGFLLWNNRPQKITA
ncbi:MAG: transglutaminase domain-containing protein [Bacteroidota bacterium]